ncbi:MAG: HPr(Ser) kinase/phosphatase [Gammaproteobacteria bacterium]|nr:HPr(Ser) kinase/phosphatase [Gammaproteobacteria bacterium]
MIDKLTPQDLFNHLHNNIDLHWIAGKHHAKRIIKRNLHLNEQATLIGHLNLIHPNRIQVLGITEWAYLNKLKKNSREDIYRQIFSDHTSAIIISDGMEIPEEFIQLANDKQSPLLSSDLSSSDLIDAIRFYLSNLLAEKTTLHGVFLEVMGTGVLITGESSVGKSELALELITRGHRLIADDAPVFTRTGPNILNGSCPEVLKDFMEVRGLGVLNIRAMYGENAIKQNKHLRLIIHLEHMSDDNQQQLDRLYGAKSVRNIMEVDIPEIKLPVASGRNLAVMVEAAVRNHILMSHGHNASEEFIKRQSQLISKQ